MSVPDDIMVQGAGIDDVMVQGLMRYQGPTDPIYTTCHDLTFGVLHEDQRMPPEIAAQVIYGF